MKTKNLADLYDEAPGCITVVTSGTQPLNFSCPNDPAQGGTDDKLNFVNYYHDTIINKFPLGSGAGVNQLCQHGQAGVAATNFARSR